MIEAYLDESGIHDGAPVCVIAGYYAGVVRWRQFEKLWRKLLSEFEVPLEEFHAKELLGRKGFFFKWTDRKYEDFIDGVTKTIAEYKIHPVSLGIVLDSFRECSESQRRFPTGGRIAAGKFITTGCPSKPYFVPFLRCIEKVASYAPYGGKAHFFFGLDRHFAGYAMEYMKDVSADKEARFSERIGTPSFPLASETPQLQAADFLSYGTYLDMQERAKHNTWHEPAPPLIKKLIKRAQSAEDFQYFDKDVIRTTFEKVYAAHPEWEITGKLLNPERDNSV